MRGTGEAVWVRGSTGYEQRSGAIMKKGQLKKRLVGAANGKGERGEGGSEGGVARLGKVRIKKVRGGERFGFEGRIK